MCETRHPLLVGVVVFARTLRSSRSTLRGHFVCFGSRVRVRAERLEIFALASMQQPSPRATAGHVSRGARR